MKDNLKEFVTLREALLKEKEELAQRLAEIEAVLSGESVALPAPARKKAARKKVARKKVAAASTPIIATPARRKKGKRIRNKVSLREMIMRVTRNNPMTKQEILEAVQREGYRFNTSNPLPSLNAVLYAKKMFKNENGRFSPAK
ncbi:MAG: hypothetical protein D6766_11285 [Verrucomicrobia bacterium]|nr:MAG: hypothetical protein D6766_11285 [Verrucomicrobiota bacterium]